MKVFLLTVDVFCVTGLLLFCDNAAQLVDILWRAVVRTLPQRGTST